MLLLLLPPVLYLFEVGYHTEVKCVLYVKVSVLEYVLTLSDQYQPLPAHGSHVNTYFFYFNCQKCMLQRLSTSSFHSLMAWVICYITTDFGFCSPSSFLLKTLTNNDMTYVFLRIHTSFFVNQTKPKQNNSLYVSNRMSR